MDEWTEPQRVDRPLVVHHSTGHKALLNDVEQDMGQLKNSKCSLNKMFLKDCS